MRDERKGLFAWFGRKDTPPVVPRERPRSDQPFHAVSIETGPQACDAAKARAGYRFLSREAPRLPLRDCTCAQCTCRYLHHADRRTFARRISDNRDAVVQAPYSGPERRTRSSPGRRVHD
jgi:hypothetical protein